MFRQTTWIIHVGFAPPPRTRSEKCKPRARRNARTSRQKYDARFLARCMPWQRNEASLHASIACLCSPRTNGTRIYSPANLKTRRHGGVVVSSDKRPCTPGDLPRVRCHQASRAASQESAFDTVLHQRVIRVRCAHSINKEDVHHLMHNMHPDFLLL